MMQDSLTTLMDSLTIDECADFISDQIQHPITIEDADNRLIAYSKHSIEIDQARMATIMGRKVPDSVFHKLWQDGVIQQLSSDDHPIRIPAKQEIGLGDRVAISIRRNQHLLGYIWVQEVDQRLGEKELQFLRLAAQALLPKLYRRQNEQRMHTEKEQEFFWKLLLNPSLSHHEIQIRAEELGLTLPNPFTIFIFEIVHPDAKKTPKELTHLFHQQKNRLSLFTFPLWTTDQQQLIILGGNQHQHTDLFSDADTWVTNLCHQMKKHLQNSHILGGFGLFYPSFQHIEQSYRQAQTVLQIKKAFPQETASINGYHDLGIYRLFPMLLEKNKSEFYTNHHLEQIMQYDRQHRGDLTHTLEVFLDYGGKIPLITKELHIHPNTLAYRLKRIAEIGNINLDDPIQRITLYMDLKLSKFKDFSL